MKLITDIPEHMSAGLKTIAAERGQTKSAVVRWAISNLLREETKNERN